MCIRDSARPAHGFQPPGYFFRQLLTAVGGQGVVCLLYTSRMTDPYVLRMQILSNKSVGGMDVADKVHIKVFSTNDSLAPEARVFRQTTNNGLYNAWLLYTSRCV